MAATCPVALGKTATYIAVLLIAAASALFAGETTLVLKPDSKLWLDGSSTLHAFHSAATKMDVQIVLADSVAGPSALLDAVKKGGARSMDVSIPIQDLKSGEKGLDRNMYKALKSDEYPEIHFKLDRYEVLRSTDGEALSVEADGKLTIDGVEKSIALNPEISASGDSLRIRGKQEILMKDYGVQPPTLMMGAIRVDNRIVVGYDLVLALRSADKSSADGRLK